MEPIDFNRWTVKELKEYLIQYDINIEDIQGSGKNGNVIKLDLIRTIEDIEEGIQLNELSMYQNTSVPIEFTDVVPTIIHNLDAKSARAINKYYYQQYSTKDILYNFIIKHFRYDNFDNIKDYFETYEIFKTYQKQQLEAVSQDLLDFLLYYMYLINNDAVEQMDKEGMDPCKTESFAFYEDKITIITYDDHANGKLPINPKNPIKNKKNAASLFTFIKTNFDDYDLKRMGNYYYEDHDLYTPSYTNFMAAQFAQISLLDEDIIQFLDYYKKLIAQDKITLSSFLFSWFDASGFIFLNNRLITFNER